MCRFDIAKEFSGPIRVPEGAGGFSFADFYTGGSEVNQALNKQGLGSRSAESVPETLPGLMSPQ